MRVPDWVFEVLMKIYDVLLFPRIVAYHLLRLCVQYTFVPTLNGMIHLFLCTTAFHSCVSATVEWGILDGYCCHCHACKHQLTQTNISKGDKNENKRGNRQHKKMFAAKVFLYTWKQHYETSILNFLIEKDLNQVRKISARCHQTQCNNICLVFMF